LRYLTFKRFGVILHNENDFSGKKTIRSEISQTTYWYRPTLNGIKFLKKYNCHEYKLVPFNKKNKNCHCHGVKTPAYHFVKINSCHLELKNNLPAKSEVTKSVHC
jgi:hypothetical protein